MAPSGSSILSTEQQIKSIWSLGGLTKRQFATKVWNGINDDNLLGRASELAYNFILAIFPMLLFLLALFGLLLPGARCYVAICCFICPKLCHHPHSNCS